MPEDNAPVGDENIESQEVDGQGDTENTPDWESQYNELRPEYTRATQELSEYRSVFEALQDPERQAEVLEALGVSAGSDNRSNDDEVDFDSLMQDDPNEALIARIAALEEAQNSSLQSRQEEERLDAEVEHLTGQLGQIEQKLGRTLSDQEVELYGQLSQNFRDENGMPNALKAHELIDGYAKGRYEDYKRSKIVGQPQGGVPSIKEDDFGDSEKRAEFMAQRVRAAREAV